MVAVPLRLWNCVRSVPPVHFFKKALRAATIRFFSNGVALMQLLNGNSTTMVLSGLVSASMTRWMSKSPPFFVAVGASFTQRAFLRFAFTLYTVVSSGGLRMLDLNPGGFLSSQ